MNCHEAEPLLHPYIDGELDAATAVGVERHIEECGACGRYFREIEELRREIRAAGLEFSPRPALARRVAAAGRASAQSAQWWRRPFAWTAVAAALAALLVMLVLPTRGPRVGRSEQEIVDAHVRSLIGSHLLDVPSSDHHTVKPWFQGKLNFSPDVPDLAAQGFVLVGGRLDVMDGAPVAAIVYRRRDHVINVFVSPGAGADTRLSVGASQGYNLVYWNQGGLRYRTISDLNSAELRAFAELVKGH